MNTDTGAAIVFAGLQKLTLLDYPDRTACTLFTAGCNFKCPFCHNPELIAFSGEAVTESYVINFLTKRRGLLDGVCISGGEPLAQDSIIDFARKIKAMGFLVKIDTNGSFPDRLKELVESAGIDYVAMDIKNAADKYGQTVGADNQFSTAPVEKSIEYLLAGKVSYEFRTTIVREFHSLEDIVSIAHLIRGTGKYYLQNFANAQRVLRPGLSAYSKAQMLEILYSVREVLPCAELRET